jgi:hypothetical protein
LSFKNKTNGQDLGKFENLEPGATTTVKIYDSSDDFFSDQEMAQASGGSLPDNVRNQKVVFARDPDNPRKLRFSTVFDEVGDVEVKLAFGDNQTEGTATCKLTKDETMAKFISAVNDRIVSVEVPGGDDVPLDVDGDGVPDGSGGSGTGTGDILQGFNAGTMAKPGAPVYEGLEDDPANLVLAINDDDDDHDSDGASGAKDNADTVIGAKDNDIATLLLKVPANLSATSGTMTLSVSGGGGVRVFKPTGSGALTNYSVNLASPSGDLATLATQGRVRVFVEGLSASSNVTFTLTYTNAQGQAQTTDAVHLMVVPRSQLTMLDPAGVLRPVWGQPMQARWRTLADNGAATWESISLAPVGEEPTVRNRGMLAKIFFDVPLNAGKTYIAFPYGFMSGFWVALKGEWETAAGVWDFFAHDPYGRSAAAWAAMKEAVAVLKTNPRDQLVQILKDLPKNLTEDLYTSAEQALPWEPISGSWSPDVESYMGGFAAGTVTEGVAISLTGAGLVAKVGTVVKGILTTAKAGRYSLSVLNELRKATSKTTHILLRLAKTEDDAAALGAAGKYLADVDLPSGKKATQRFVEAFADKPQLMERCLKHWDDAWKDLPPERRNLRIKLAARRVAELKEIMGSTLSDDALEGFTLLQKKLFKENVDDSDRFEDLKALWKGLDNSSKKTSLNDSLSAYKTAATSDPEAKFWIKNITGVQSTAYRYSSFAPSNGWSSFTGSFPSRPEGWYASFDLYDNKYIVTDRLLLPLETSAPKYRFEFDTSAVQQTSRMVRGEQDTAEIFEPICRDEPVSYPGGGTSLASGGSQFKVDGAFPVTRVVDLDTGQQVWP